jgi:hypothetical protein
MPLPPSPLRTAIHALAAAGITAAAFALPTLMAAGVRVAVPNLDLIGGADRPFASFDAPFEIALADLPKLPEPPPPEARFAHVPTRTEARPPPPPPPAELILAKVAAPPAPAPTVAPLDAEAVLREAAPLRARLDRLGQIRASDPDGIAARRARNRPPPCDSAVAGITQVAEGHFSVERAVLDHYTTLREALKLAYVTWHKDDDGKIDGFSVYRIRCGNPLAQVGLRNGDVIHTINGKKIRSIPHAILVVAKVKRKDRIQVFGTRRGEPLHIVAEVI